MGPTLYWITGPWTGRLAISARPRGGEWLADEIAGWKAAGIDAVVSLLAADENTDLDLNDEPEVLKANRIRFIGFSIPDRGIPGSQSEFAALISSIRDLLRQGENVVVHCRQGIGRSGMVASALIAENGTDYRTAVERVNAARGVVVPETQEQMDWLAQFISKPNPAASTSRTR